ncbi:hypothetical protein RJ639_013170 [Escallonia herrerae]|uniref:Uncharacterized protein n=1 Tax=Escallonia herrerae TaxID=1293975 RepID=A0AA89AN39_9ASTE|nr:hypothetical protein RJ639_013170 [Escallonia herrerae]
MKDCSGRKAQPSSKASISRFPQKLRKLKESAYTPRIVSIGPYHKHDERPKDMEDHQKSYMNSLLSRVRPKPNQPADAAIKEITNKILEKVADARSCYAASYKRYDDVRRKNADHPQNGDPILGNTLVFLDVRHDLLLLENQIPMFVLQTLCDFSLVQPYTLFDLIISFFGKMLNLLKIRKVLMTETAAYLVIPHHIICYEIALDNIPHVLDLASSLKVGMHSTLNSARKKMNQVQAMLELLCRDCLRAHINCVSPRPHLPLTIA